eukprot:1742_1
METQTKDTSFLLTPKPTDFKERKKTILIRISVSIFILTVIIVIILVTTLTSSTSSTTKNWTNLILSIPSAEISKNHSFHLTRKPHILGTPQNYIYGLYFKSILDKLGYDTYIQNFTSNVSRYNHASLHIVDQNNNSNLIQLDLSEDVIPDDPTSNTSIRHQAFNGWSANGNATANLVYVNFAHRDDFELLQSLNISLNGTIGIAKYGGGMFRGVKSDMAGQYGMVGLLLYSDPMDYGYSKGLVFPQGPWLPKTGYQRGSVQFIFRCPGSLNPDRIQSECDFSKNEIIPNVPIMPLSYGNAELLMKHLDGYVIDQWQGTMNFTYHTGFGNTNQSNMTVKISVDNLEQEAVLTNIIGCIEGTKYSNQSILIGAHRDSWIFGGSDDVSGTSIILETARTLSVLIHKHNFRPLRSICFASWDGEEQSLDGSTSFVEMNESYVDDKYIAYFNLDSMGGPYISVRSSPLIMSVVINALKVIPEPYSDGSETVYDIWKQRNFPDVDDDQVYANFLGSGSDYTAFLHKLGIETFDSRFQEPGGFKGTYHSVYDSFKWMEIVDEDWEYHKTEAIYFALVAFELMNNDILPFVAENIYTQMRRWLDDLMPTWANRTQCQWTEIAMDAYNELNEVIEDFGQIAKQFDEDVAAINSNDQFYEETVECVNNIFKLLPKKFVTKDGLPGRKWYKNILYAPDILSGYDAYPYPEILYAFQFNCTEEYIMENTQATASMIYNASRFLESNNCIINQQKS